MAGNSQTVNVPGLLPGVVPTVEVVGWRDANGNDFEIDEVGNLTSTPLDVRKLFGNTADRVFIDDPERA